MEDKIRIRLNEVLSNIPNILSVKGVELVSSKNDECTEQIIIKFYHITDIDTYISIGYEYDSYSGDDRIYKVQIVKPIIMKTVTFE